VKEDFQAMETRENEQWMAFGCLLECEKDGDVEVIIFSFEDGESQKDKSMKEFDLTTTINVHECAGLKEAISLLLFQVKKSVVTLL
jgi:hypothetical protein